MSETHGDRRVFSLQEVARSIQKTIAERYGSVYWIRAEMNKLNHYPHSGHCFPELVEKKEGRVVAEMRSILWSSDYQRINRQFLELVKEPLKDGITVLFQASIQYDPLYGLSLKIHDIDPSFALGQLEIEKQQSIARLKKEGIFGTNKGLPFPLVPKRLAIISVESSKGYSDFLQIIEGNPWNYKFEQTLFPALLQGDRSVGSIREQLGLIALRKQDFDVVLIIRGGGGDVGLSSYNHYELAAEIARFPLPVMTGIGHSTNETVSEMVAHRNAITPSELADFLIQHFHAFAEPVQQAERVLAEKIPNLLAEEHQKIEKIADKIGLSVTQALATQRQTLIHQEWSIRSGVQTVLQSQHHLLSVWKQTLRQISVQQVREHFTNLHQLEKQVELLDPIHVLKRGFSITTDESGRAILDPGTLEKGQKIRTHVAGGTIESSVIDIQKDKNHGE